MANWTRFLWLVLVLMALLSVYADDVVVEDDDSVDVEVDAEESPKKASVWTEEEEAKIQASAKEHKFQAEVNRVMDIVINSLYTERSTFLRELISNSADALKKIRVSSLTDETALQSGDELGIFLKVDKEANTISIRDTGIGMTAAEMEEHLGQVGGSGTAKFLQAMENADNSEMIGQFGVGFYSAFLVANEVEVISKSNNETVQHVWRSYAEGSYTISEDPRGPTLGRGTEIILHMRDDASEFLSNDELERIVHRYSEFVSFPISIWTSKEVTTEVPIEEEEDEADKTEDEEDKDKEDGDDDELDVEEDEEDDKPKTKTVTETVWEWKVLNDEPPLWTRSKNDISEDDYKKFYKSLTKSHDDPLKWIHFKAEGEIDFTGLLYIPEKAPRDL